MHSAPVARALGSGTVPMCSSVLADVILMTAFELGWTQLPPMKRVE
jgi:hypothetical protein